ncbi:hypothetical protein [Amycolatopsis sp. GM8]|uniref:hypothetical protein n=1 Tax=Amycolatopsis sp. GM8 TaxID=2896530 RepID=UPI001F3C8F15|nr:hypothetical protein [Amycolatopsis sp. GM8]
MLLPGPELAVPLPLDEVSDVGADELLDGALELELGGVDDEEDGGVVDDEGGFVCVVLLVGGGSSPRGGLVGFVGGIVVPGGMNVPGGIGAPGGSTTGCWFEPRGGTIVTTGVPSGPTLTTATGDVVGSGWVPLTVMVPGTALPEMTCGPDGAPALPALMSAPAFVDGDASSAMPPNAVASTTPLTASST